MNGFTPWRLAQRGLRGHRRAHTAIAAGVAVATAVLVGALVVGESVRGSLRDLTLQRLGKIDQLIAPGRPFRAALADEIESAEAAAPLLVVPASMSVRIEGQTRHASRLTLVGCDRRFFAMESTVAEWPESDDGLLITRAIADELGVKAGDRVLVTTTLANALPADSALGEKADTVASRRLTVAGVVPPEGLARFALSPSQGEPRNVFAPLGVVQELMDLAGEGNAVAVQADAPVAPAPRLADYGLELDELRPGVWQLESRELVTPAAIVAAARKAWSGSPLLEANTYLANTIRLEDRSIPYSTVAGLSDNGALLPEGTVDLADDEIALNRWAADDLGAQVGNTITLTYYEPESTHGELQEAEPVSLKLAAIVELTDDAGQPTVANDPRWTPELKGVTDAESINNWDLPFELVETIRDEDEAYWDDYRTTPKAFVSLALSQKLWGSRWGDTSLVRVEAGDCSRGEIEKSLLAAIEPGELGFAPIPIKQRGLAAASGNTPFDVLFLLFSMFLIAAALLLIVLLVWLAIDQRRREVGLLGAVGFDRASVRGALLRELAPVAALGAIVGAALGLAFAAGLLWLLRTVWVAAIGTPFLKLHAGPLSVGGGALGAWLVAMLAIVWAVRRATATPPRDLLAGASHEETATTGGPRGSNGLAWGAATLAGLSALFGGTLQGEAAAGAFFATGGLALVALLTWLYRFAQQGATDGASGFTLPGLARLNLRRRPGRALLTIGLMAAACFLLLATSAFRLPPTTSGTGGFDLVLQTDQPLHYDLGDESGRWELGFGDKEEHKLAEARAYGFRVQPGEDASCRNLYQTTQPRVLGVGPRFIASQDGSMTPFVWADSEPTEGDSPWALLSEPANEGQPPRVFLDFNTAMYSLKLVGGVGSTFEIRDGVGRPVTVRLAGLLKNSVLQGDLLMGEADFLRLFPTTSGYRFFLIETDQPEVTAALLENTLSDYGADAEDAPARLADFLAVQNTYLSTFQSLGGLGLLLGAIGLTVAQFRNLLERRGELALMRAGGYTVARLRRLVLIENLTLLALGLAAGAIAAAATLLPLAAASDARPPWLMAALLLGATLLIGLAASRWAAARALNASITTALRGE
ncbi:FtsX-like permease family protein [Planctomycetes bacterium MalM25]|nr:FtsX-like permease family protein [Planctomycetes bacterium MalM25]